MGYASPLKLSLLPAHLFGALNLAQNLPPVFAAKFAIFNGEDAVDQDVDHADGGLVGLEGGAALAKGLWVENSQVGPGIGLDEAAVFELEAAGWQGG